MTAYARLDFDTKVSPESLLRQFKEEDEETYMILSALSIGINMLGEELGDSWKKLAKEKDGIEKEFIETRKMLHHTSKLASIGELSAGVVHEVNNPLTIAEGKTQQLRELIESSDDVNLIKKNSEKILNTINRSHYRIEKIVGGLRKFSRLDIEENKIFNIHDMLWETMSFVKDIYEKQNIRLVFIKEKSKSFCKWELWPVTTSDFKLVK